MKVLVTGGSGMVGSYLKETNPDWIYLSSSNCDLLSFEQVKNTIDYYSPDCVVHLAAKVGGIADNMNNPFEYYEQNVLMNTNVFRVVRNNKKVKQFIGILSTCAYQDESPIYPITEEMIYDGMPNVTNLGYGFSKRMLAMEIDMARNNGMNYSYIIPSNLYGKYETGNFFSKHFIGALIDKIIQAEENGSEYITLFGDGTPIRQFTYAGDVARIIDMMVKRGTNENMNVSIEQPLSVNEIAKLALEATGNTNLQVRYDTSMPNGQHRRDVSIEKLKKVFPNFEFTSYIDGIKMTYEYTKTNKGKAR